MRPFMLPVLLCQWQHSVTAGLLSVATSEVVQQTLLQTHFSGSSHLMDHLSTAWGTIQPWLTTDLAAGMPQFSLDSDFRWSRDNYSSTQRSVDIWSFIISLRTKLYLLDQKWSYVGGWTEEKKTERSRATACWTRCTPAALTCFAQHVH